MGKTRLGLIPPHAEEEVGKVLTFGAEKYGARTWQDIPDLHDRYIDAALRHVAAYRKGERFDEESSLEHLAHAVCCLMFVLETDLK